MVGTGLRVDECLIYTLRILHLIDRQKSKKIIQSEIKLDDNSRYYCKIWVSKLRHVNGIVSLFHQHILLLQRLINLYKTTGLGQIKGTMFGELILLEKDLIHYLDEADLKHIKEVMKTLSEIVSLLEIHLFN